VKLDTALPWIVRAIVVLALAAIVAWIATKTRWEETTVPLPLHGEARTNPQYAQKVFLASLGLKVETRKNLGAMPPSDAVIFIESWHWDLIDSRRRALEEWIRSGGRLVVDTSLIDSLDTFAEFSGITREFPSVDEDDENDENEEEEESKNEAESEETIRALAPPGSVDAISCAEWKVSIDPQGASGSRKDYNFCPVQVFGWLTTASDPVWAVSDEDGYQAVRVQRGAGSVTFINSMLLFGNRAFKDVSRGALYVAAGQLRHGDAVWLLTEMEHPSLLTLVWRYGAPVVILFGVFVVAAVWRNAARFGPLRAPPIAARRSLAEQIRGTGGFIIRLGGSRTLYNAMARSVKEEAVRLIARYASLTPQQQVDALVARTGVDRDDLQYALFVAPNSSHRQQLYKAIAILETTRRVLAYERTTPLQTQTDQSAGT